MRVKILKGVSLFLLFMLLIIALPLLVMQTPQLKSWLAAYAGKTVSRSLNADLVVGSIHGNFISNIELRNVTLALHGDTIAFLPKVSLHHSLQSLVHQRLVVDSLIVENPQLNISQMPDSSWVFAHLLPAQKDTAVDRKANELGISIDVRKFGLTNGSFKINSYNALLPKRIDSVNIAISALIAQSQLLLSLDDFSLKTHAPDFELKQLTFSLHKNNELTKLEHFILRTGNNQLVANAGVDSSAVPNARLQAESEKLDPAEFSYFFPALAMLGKPSLSFKADVRRDDLWAALTLASKQSRVSLSGHIKNYASLSGMKSTIEPAYEISAICRNVSLSDFLPNYPASAHLNADVNVSGIGISKETAIAKADILVFESTIEKRDIDTLLVAAKYENNKVTGNQSLQSPAGSVDADFVFEDLWKSQKYTIFMRGRQINAHRILLDDRYTTLINFSISAQGAGFDFSTGTADIAMTLDNSTVLDIPIDTLFVAGRISTDEFQIESCIFENSIASLNGSGTLSQHKDSDVLVDILIKDAAPFASILSIDTLAVQGKLSAHIQGRPDSLALSARLFAYNLMFNEITLDSVHSDLDAERVNNVWTVSGAAEIDSLAAGGAKIGKIHAESVYMNERLESQLKLAITDDIKSQIRLIFQTLDGPQLLVPDFSLDVKGRQWRGENIALRFDKDALWFDQFRLYCNENDDVQRDIEINGVLRTGGEENLQMNISNMNLSLPAAFIPGAGGVGGNLDMSLKIGGTAANPEIFSFLKITDGRYNDYSVNRIEAKAHYSKKELQANVLLAPRSDSLQFAAKLPMSLSIEPPLIQFEKESPLDLRIVAEKFPVQDAFDQGKTPQLVLGDLSINLQAGNSWNNLSPYGFIGLENGRASFEELGALFENIGFRFDINPDSVVIKKVSIQRGKGKITAGGFALPSRDFSQSFLDTFQLKLELDRYLLSTKPEHKLQVSSKLNIHGSQNDLQFSGDVQVLQSSFYLPALIKKGATKSAQNAPLLVQAMSTAPLDTTHMASDDSVIIQVETPDYFQKMRGTVHVSIPKNTWIKSENMRIELAGDLDIRKEKNITLAGTIKVLRGQIDYLGRRFLLTKGEIVFQNQEQIDPLIDIAADYRFRDIHNKKRSLTLLTSGALSAPTISFVMDDNKITTEDAVSYILFQRAPGELGIDEQASAGAQTKQAASNFIYGMASASLSRRLGATIGLDYMEIKGQENWNSATFVMGKYLTPDLFVSYEHSVGALEEDRKPQVMTIEYELTKYFFLQLISGDTKTTGADIIFKIDR